MQFDIYTLRARLFPAFLVFLPFGLGIVSLFPEKIIGWGAILSLLASCGFTMLLAQMARDPGKKKEKKLFDDWGGTPTTLLLRHREEKIDLYSLERVHRKLTELTGILLPTKEEEQQNHSDADQKYESCIRYLREATRDKKKFSLVFSENVNYGFRRNLWSMKPIGIFLTLLGIFMALFSIVMPKTVFPYSMFCLLIDLLLLIWWCFSINPDWVKNAAFTYANTLIATCDTL